jgi:hypothetical protein
MQQNVNNNLSYIVLNFWAELRSHWAASSIEVLADFRFSRMCSSQQCCRARNYAK